MSEDIEHVKCLIIGSGPAGYTAAIYAARADMKPVLYQGLQPGGQLTETTDVDNYPGYPEGVNGPQMMIDFQRQAERFDTDIRSGWITEVDFTGPKHKVVIDDGKKTITADSVIISTGASAKWLGLESEIRLRDMGGGDTACEEASYLGKLCKKVYMLVRRDEFRASAAMQKRVEEMENIEIMYHHEALEVLGENAVEGVRVINNQTKEEKTLNVTGFFVAIGHKPNTDPFKKWLKTDNQGYIIKKPDSAKTDVEGVFVSGDAADKVYRQAVTAAGTGCMAALDAERYLAEKGLH